MLNFLKETCYNIFLKLLINIAIKNVVENILKKMLDSTFFLNKCWCNYFKNIGSAFF
jgi:hypothetical protein